MQNNNKKHIFWRKQTNNCSWANSFSFSSYHIIILLFSEAYLPTLFCLPSIFEVHLCMAFSLIIINNGHTLSFIVYLTSPMLPNMYETLSTHTIHTLHTVSIHLSPQPGNPQTRSRDMSCFLSHPKKSKHYPSKSWGLFFWVWVWSLCINKSKSYCCSTQWYFRHVFPIMCEQFREDPYNSTPINHDQI